MRLHLQCTAEMTPILTEQIGPGHNDILSDFNVIHMCKNFDELKVWTRSNALHQIRVLDSLGHEN